MLIKIIEGVVWVIAWAVLITFFYLLLAVEL